jgi:hypothetical protein
MNQIEIEKMCNVLDDNGRPESFGWARRPLYSYNKEKVRVRHRYITEMDRYCFFSQTHLFLFEIEDSGFLGSIRITSVSLRDKKSSQAIFTSPFSLGGFDMPHGSEQGAVRLHQKRALIEFWSRLGGSRIIKIDIPLLTHAISLRGEVVLMEPDGAQPLVTHCPWRDERYAFRLTRTSPWYFVEGVIQTGNQDIVFTPGKAFGMFQWSRGLRPRADLIYYAFGCGVFKKKQISFTLGYCTADTTAATDNAFFIDGKLHKLSSVTFQISPKDWLLPWQFTSADGKIELTFRPILGEIAHSRIFWQSCRIRQFFGYFSGRVLQEDGSFFTFKNITGMTERKKTKF